MTMTPMSNTAAPMIVANIAPLFGPFLEAASADVDVAASFVEARTLVVKDSDLPVPNSFDIRDVELFSKLTSWCSIGTFGTFVDVLLSTSVERDRVMLEDATWVLTLSWLRVFRNVPVG